MNVQPSVNDQRASDRLASVRTRLSEQAGGEAKLFFDAFFAQYEREDILNHGVEAMVGAALTLWRFAESRPLATAKVKVFNARLAEQGWSLGHSIAQIVTDDMPFLVDSVAGCLAAMNIEVHLFAHPITTTTRDASGRRAKDGTALRESVMHIEFDQQIDQKRIDEIEAKLAEVLLHVRYAVGDWKPMLAKLAEAREDLIRHKPPIEPAALEEAIAFLDWAADNNFTFLGFRDYQLTVDAGGSDMEMDRASALGVLRDPKIRIVRRSGADDPYSAEILSFLKSPDPLIITKANHRSTVHRTTYMDYLGVKRFGDAGEVVGERRFVGLFTSAAYNRSPFEVPILRRRVNAVIDRAGFAPASHNGKALAHVLETYPRDELFQLSEDELLETSLGMLRLEQRPRTRVFIRRDKFERYVSALVFVPRERFDTNLRLKIGLVLSEAFSGSVSAFYPSFGEGALIRVHFIIRTTPGQIPAVDLDQLEERLRLVARTWRDDLADSLREQCGEAEGNAKLQRFADAFPAAYREKTEARHALGDIAKIEDLDRAVAQHGDAAIAVDLYRRLGDGDSTARFKLFRKGAHVALSDCLPELEDLGLRVIAEEPYAVQPPGEPVIWLHDFEVVEAQNRPLDLARCKNNFEDAFIRVWNEDMESDGFNRLIMSPCLDWRQISLLRAIGKYLRQAGIPYSLAYMADTLARQPKLAKLMIDLFMAHFDPELSEVARDASIEIAHDEIEDALNAVPSLDEDRILRRYRNVIDGMLRTNYFLPGRPTIAFKLSSKKLDELPPPVPFVEIWVYSPRVEGIHLRGGPVARGGLRWSDRREDFRTEILGLMKAQQVKNAVIVPVGAKGGFFPKKLPAEGRDAIQAEAIAAYKLFVNSLLELTDNRLGAKIEPPAGVLRLDSDDPYLVVAADKGTATFSDIANSLSIARKFWLGDAFASGGSAGYDHKKMGITARGAWEAVKRHFREIGKDIQSESFTVVGVGDMSGDVFGNGMLLSKTTRLLAAFDHRHIFFDPDPDIEKSYAERRRLFDLPRSSWDDYDKSLISPGGGVYPRGLKSMPLNDALRKLTGLGSEHATPAEVIRALLKAPVDLLWFGGIGTYVKASAERNADVGDRANDALRIDGADINALVVGEGANLGCTQRGRIEYALKGGRLNTDAIDNSAGVDCSDHEVNIKILLESVIQSGDMTMKQRDQLLVEMTEDVGAHVLRDNYLQTLSLSLAQLRGVNAVERQISYMRRLERLHRLDRAVEYLPDDDALKARGESGKGLTRPELAVLMAYAKLHLFDEILGSALPDEPTVEAELMGYFPKALSSRFQGQIRAHGLRREIIATVLANEIVNKGGPTFVAGIADEVGAQFADVAAAYRIANDVFEVTPLWNAIDALDNKVPAEIQLKLYWSLRDALRRETLWFLREASSPAGLSETIARYRPGVRSLKELAAVPADSDWLAAGVPEPLARAITALREIQSAGDVIDIAKAVGRDIRDAGAVHAELGRALGIDRLFRAADAINPPDQWTRLALRAVTDDLAGYHRRLATAVLQEETKDPIEAATAWLAERASRIEPLHQLIADVEQSGAGVAQLAVANRHLRALAPR